MGFFQPNWLISVVIVLQFVVKLWSLHQLIKNLNSGERIFRVEPGRFTVIIFLFSLEVLSERTISKVFYVTKL